MAEMMHVSGLSELKRALSELPNRVATKQLRAAVLSGAVIVRDAAKIIAPISTGPVATGHPPPGTLRRAIYMARSNRDRGPGKEVAHVFVRQAPNGSAGKKGVKKYGKLDAYYWRWVEFGTSKMAAHPFMRPAFEANKERAVEAIKTRLAQGVEDEARALNP
jgi:HK97 gp10 family phage protein